MMLASKHAIPVMIQAGGGHRQYLLDSAAPAGAHLLHSKGAVIALTRAMAIDHAKQGIRVNCIAPGPMYTPMAYSAGMSDEAREFRRRASPLGIEGTGWDIGYAALFLASDEARYITGVVLTVDGGVTLASPPRGYERSPS
jgi:NAD(P)-dependent dehydrogenase (short-subunit alcohol dehydrogenase family)